MCLLNLETRRPLGILQTVDLQVGMEGAEGNESVRTAGTLWTCLASKRAGHRAGAKEVCQLQSCMISLLFFFN